jgi:branched-chain amino acid transport system substrate-binding protein
VSKHKVGRFRPVLALVVLALALFVGVGCGGDDDASGGGSGDGGGTAADKSPIKIGALVDDTGPSAFFGPFQRDGIKLAVKQAGGKVGGRPIEVVFMDSGGDLATAEPKARQLVEEQKVSMVFGPLQSDVMAGLLPYFQQNEIPVLSHLNHPRELAEQDWLFTPQGVLNEVTAPGGVYAAAEKGAKAASTLGSDYIAGQDVIGGFCAGLEAHGGKCVQKQFAPLTATDFGPYLSKIDQAADSFAVWQVGATDAVAAEYLNRQPLKNTFLGYADQISEEQLPELGDETVGWTGPLTYTWRLDNPANDAFVKAVQDEYKRRPFTEVDEAAWESTTIMLEALKATGGDTDPTGLKDALLNVKMDTPGGPLRFEGNGIGIRDVYILEVKKVDGEFGWVPVGVYKDVGATDVKQLELQPIG